MKVSAPVIIAALFSAAVSGLAVEKRDSSAVNIEVPLVTLPHFANLTHPGAEVVTSSSAKEKRSDELSKRAILTVDVYEDINFGGRHQGLITTTQTCYGLYNGWNDVISSLKVPGGFGCYFYKDGGCYPNDPWLRVTGPYNVANTGQYGFNDNISSYLCYN